MGNWLTITIDDLKAAGHGDVVDAAQSQSVGSTDPVSDAIIDSIATIRGAISVGNTLDADVTKIPRSLKSLCERMAYFRLVERIGMELTQDQRDTKKNDQSYLNRIIDSKIRFEKPDVAGGSAEMQSGSGIDVMTSTNRNNYTREGMDGL